MTKETMENEFGVAALANGGAKLCYEVKDPCLTRKQALRLAAWVLTQAEIPLAEVAQALVDITHAE